MPTNPAPTQQGRTLEPCLCKSAIELRYDRIEVGNWVQVVCDNCGRRGAQGGSQWVAEKLWNQDRRTAVAGPRGDAWREAASIVEACLNVHSTYSDAEREFASHLIEVFKTRDQHPDYRHRNTVRAYPAATSSSAPAERTTVDAERLAATIVTLWRAENSDDRTLAEYIKQSLLGARTGAAATASSTPAESVCRPLGYIYNRPAEQKWCVTHNQPMNRCAAPAESTRVEGEQATRFKVGDRLRNIHASYLPIATVTAITERGFKYELERPFVISPRLGTQTGGESYDDSQWEIAVSDSARRAAEEIVKAWLWHTHEHDQKRALENITAIISRHFAAAPADNDAEYPPPQCSCHWYVNGASDLNPQCRIHGATTTKGDR